MAAKVMGSPVGVMAAAAIVMISTAQRRPLAS